MFLDDYSGLGSIVFLKKKLDATVKFCDWLVWAERQSGYKLLKLRLNQGGGYISSEIQDQLASKEIEHQKTVPRVPQQTQNGRTEHFNRPILEKAKAMRHAACLPPTFWQDAVETSLHVYN